MASTGDCDRRAILCIFGLSCCGDDGSAFSVIVIQGKVLVLEFVPQGRFSGYRDIKIESQ